MNPWSEVDRLRAKVREQRHIIAALCIAVVMMACVLVLAR